MTRRLAAAAWLLAALAAPVLAAPPETRLWRDLLREDVTVRGEVSYARIARERRNDLVAYLKALAAVRLEDLSWDETVATLLNAYNATVVLGIVDGHSPETLAGRARLYHWVRVDVGGQSFTLDDLGARLASLAASDPRIHFALCDGTRRAPRLATQAFSSRTLDAQLAWVTRRYVRDPERVIWDPAKHRLELSTLFQRHEADFERSSGSVEAFLAAWIRDEALSRALRDGRVDIDFHPDDWRSNAAAGDAAEASPAAAPAK